jgi:transcription factor C subunit 6
MAGYGSEEENDGLPEAGPSSDPKKRPVVLSDMDSGSEFAPEKEELKLLEDQDKEEDEVVEPVADEDDTSDADGKLLPPPSKRRAGVTSAPKKAVKAKATASIVSKPSTSGPSLSRTSKRQQYILPTPSVHHRHRAVPLYSRAGRVERLASRPYLFRSYDVVMTNNFTHNAKVTDRVNKSWGYNVGSGPLWDLVEDRGWYKEAVEGIPDMDTETHRRPKVCKDVKVKDGWEILNETYAC